MLLPLCLSASLHPNLWSTLMTRLCPVNLGHLVNALLLPWTHERLAQLSAPFQETSASPQHPDFSSVPPHLPSLAAHCHPPEPFTSKALMTVTITSIPTASFRPISSLFCLFSQLTLQQNHHHFSRKHLNLFSLLPSIAAHTKDQSQALEERSRYVWKPTSAPCRDTWILHQTWSLSNTLHNHFKAQKGLSYGVWGWPGGQVEG